MFKKILDNLKNRKMLVLAVLLFFALNIFVIYTTFSEKTTSIIWDGTVSKKFNKGSGSSTDPYIISNGSELAYFFTVINSEDSSDYFNKFYELTNNIDLNGYDFSFAENKTFSGNFNGNGYSIFNFKLSKYYFNDEGTVASISLFDSLYSARIQNLNIYDVEIISNEKDVLNKAAVKSTVDEDDEENVTTLEEKNENEEEKEEDKKEETKENENTDPVIDNKEEDNKEEDNKENEEEQPSESENDKEEDKEKDNEKEDNKESEVEDNTSEEENNTEENSEEDNKENEEENTEEEQKEDEVIEAKVERIEISLLAKNVEESIIENINVDGVSLSYNGIEENLLSSLLVLNDIAGNKFTNINMVGESSVNNTSALIRVYNDAEISNIIYMDNHLELITGYEDKNEATFKYSIKNGKVVFDNDYPIKSIVGMLNDSSKLNWKYENNKFRIQNNGSNPALKGVAKASAKRSVNRAAPSAHASGKDGTIVYINDYESDANYYEGLNYTYSSNGTTPTSAKKNIYNDTNLVYVEMHYYGRNYDNTYAGKLSASENYNQFVYYKIYEVNNNGTASNKNDDYIKVELIDNPFQGRPNGKAFNGWATDYAGAEITLDRTIYTRFIKIPVTYTGDNPNNINANVYATWTNGVHVTSSNLSNLSNSSLKDYEFTAVTSIDTVYDDVDGLYARRTVNWFGSYPSGAVNSSGNSLTGTCNSFGGCTYYIQVTGSYEPGTTYYRFTNGTMTQYTVPSHQELTGELSEGDSTAGFYRRVTIPNGRPVAGYYDSSGNLLTSGNSNGGNYYDLIQFYDDNNNREVAVTEVYYYLGTRDTNIVRISGNVTQPWSSSLTHPFTLTSIDNGTNNYSTYYWNLYGNNNNSRYRVTCYSDLRIEDIRIRGVAIQTGDSGPTSSAYSYLYGGYHNVKLGRGIGQQSTSNTSFAFVAGGNNGTTTIGSASNPKRYRLIIESGTYNTISSTSLSTNSSKTIDVDQVTILGNDYDRISEDNSKLNLIYSFAAIWSGSHYRSNYYDTSFTTIVKSGQFGSRKYDYSAGIYVSGRGYASSYAASEVIVEGGYIYNLNGGPSPKTDVKSSNIIYIYMKGGSVDVLVGGAGRSQTYGNRIIQVTDGTVNYAVFGGSNGVTGSDGSDTTNGKLDGDSYIYIGGGATIGDTTLGDNAVESESNVEAGSVFGNGNGNQNSTTIGTVNNSTIIIDGNATINKNVYGGGNYGAGGQNGTNKTYNLNIIVHDGEIKGSIYGGGNNNGAGTVNNSNNAVNTANVYITMDGGTVDGSIYGGSRTKGKIIGSTNINITGGTVYTDVYGGGEGGHTNNNSNTGTFVKNNVSITIGDNSGGPNINGNVYGGSAYGTVNQSTISSTANSNTVSVTVNNGSILGSVFGGAKGSSQNTPNVNGNVSVTINNNSGTIPKVFGGCDEAGEPLGTVTVTINGGRITDAFGGGNKTSVGTTNIYLEGGSVNTLYGGSNQSGVVTTSNVYIDGGTVGTVYGGNNEGGMCNTSNVELNGGTINGIVYGGGNLVDTGSTHVKIKNISNTLSAVYGGGNRAGATSTSVVLRDTTAPNNISITDVYGGSNQSGTVASSSVEVNKGTVSNVYGGNHSGGSTTSATVAIKGGTVTTTYGGGDNAATGTAVVTVSGGTATTVYGGGNRAATTTATVNVTGGSTTTVYGGGNQGVVTTPHVNISGGTNATVYGGGRQANINGNTDVNVSGGTISTAVYGGGQAGAVTGNTSVLITNNSGTIPEVYGGGQQAGATNTSVVIGDNTNGTISLGTVYGGSNQSGNITSTSIEMNKGTVANIYGGNNAGGTSTTTDVDIKGGSVTGDVYGGGNQAVSTSTSVEVSGGSTNNVYGGGNQAAVTTTSVTLSGGTSATVFGGGNQANVTGDTYVVVSGGAVTSALYGGGNLGAVVGDTNVLVESNSGTIPAIYGGGNRAGAANTNIIVGNNTVGTITVSEIYGGSNQLGFVTESTITVNDGNIISLYGGNNAGGSTTTTNVEVTGGSIGTLYGGGNRAVTNDSHVDVSGGSVATIYGGGNLAAMNAGTDVSITGGNHGVIYGGGNGNAATITTNTSLIIKNATTSGNIYGGGNAGSVTGNTVVVINGAHIGGSAYAGGDGSTAVVSGNTEISVGGSSEIGSSTCTLLSQCSVFGGGNAAATGSELTNNSTATVKIAGGTIHGNVYGGPNTSKIYGQTYVNVGADVATTTDLTRGAIAITGTVFGGGEANASGSPTYDWTFVSVTRGTSVNINGNNYQTCSISGSIFGSGNASTTSGTSEIVIKNFGTFANPNRGVSIQRADSVTIEDSAILLSGATDRENEFSDVLFTLSRIDELNLINNGVLFLETGANLLKEFNSLDTAGDKAEVKIKPNQHTYTRTADNRVYMYIDKKLNIAKNQAVTDYGEVNGMTFFGMYKYNANNSVNVGIYGDYAYEANLNWSDVFYNVSSYVLGLHETDHDITVDGFYTNYIVAVDENTAVNKMDYIEPSPPSGPLYMWIIGESVIEYTIDLSASKYSTLGTYELSLMDFTDPNTTFQILGFDYSELDSSVSLVEKTQIKKIADTNQEADTIMGLSMESSNIGWLVNGSTYFLTNPNNSIVGTRDYIGGNNASAPTLLFNLHHSKNISTNGDLGKVIIQMKSIRQVDALTKETKQLIITINITRALIATVNYEGAMTAGRKYDLFTSTATNISSSSSISVYYSLFNSGSNIYRAGYHRALISNYVFPLNTKITMIDLSGNNPEYYYHVINATDVAAATQEMQQLQEASYEISMFEVMGAENSGVYYDDVAKNTQYYNATTQYTSEDFIFIIDFGDTTISDDALGNQLLFEIRNTNNEAIYGVLGQQYSVLMYNIYTDKDAIISMTGTLSSNKIYNGETVIADLHIDYTQDMVGSTVIYDTHYFDSKLGLKISLINSDNEVVTGFTLLGLYYTIDEVRYDPNIDGTTRIKVADKVDSAEKWVIINTGTSTIPSGNYILRFESFGSPDGIYYGLNSSDHIDFNIEIVNEIYGLDVSTTPENMIIDSLTGKNGNGQNRIDYTIKYNSGLTNPSIRFKMYRRKYDHYDDTDYELITAQDYFNSLLTASANEDEYILINSPGATNSYMFVTGEELVTGTYKMEFILYDGNAPIGSVEKYIIIK